MATQFGQRSCRGQNERPGIVPLAEVNSLKALIDSKENKINSLERELKEYKDLNDAKIKDLEGEIQKLKTEKKILEENVVYLQGELDLVKRKLEKEPTHVLKASLLIATMCDEMETMMFASVFPEDFNRHLSYMVQDIESKLKKMKVSQREAKRPIWDALKAELSWDQQHLDTVIMLKRIRNEKAHPTGELTEGLLRESLKRMNEDGYFEKGLSLDVASQLITMWKTLKERVSMSD